MRSHTAFDGARAALLAACCFAPAPASQAPPAHARPAQQPAARPIAAPADPEIERGIQLFQQNDAKGAAKAFRAAAKKRRDDPVPWVYLAQALMRAGDLREALKASDTALKLNSNLAAAHAHRAVILVLSDKRGAAEAAARRAVELDPQQADARYALALMHLRAGAWVRAAEEADAIIKVNDRFAPAYSIKAQAMLGLYERGVQIISEDQRGAFDHRPETLSEVESAQPRWLNDAADSLEKYLQLAHGAQDAEEARTQVESLRFYAKAGTAAASRDHVHKAAEVTRKATIRFRPEPDYSEEARRANVTGVVRLRAVLGWDGKVRHVLVLRGLPPGLTERAVAAARRIKFEPARVGEMPVSQWVVIEYNFNIY
jgi:TonB family protein